MDDRPVLLVPQKDLAKAKGRMSLAAPRRRELAVAMLRNTVTAAQAANVRQVVVVLDNPHDEHEIADLDALAFSPGTYGMNPSLSAAEELVRMLWGHVPLVVVPTDLPLITTSLVDRALRRAAGDERAFIPDRSGTGTTLLFAGPAAPLRPAYGLGSAVAHERQGARRILDEDLERLRHDVDNVSDLHAAQLRLEHGSLREGTA
ncbi:2-phospho-L-lactate guanylyltransferase [Nocardioides sp. AN3]